MLAVRCGVLVIPVCVGTRLSRFTCGGNMLSQGSIVWVCKCERVIHMKRASDLLIATKRVVRFLSFFRLSAATGTSSTRPVDRVVVVENICVFMVI